VEAKFFLSLLYLNYEKDLKVASEYAADLYREFPENTFYTGKYLEILLYNRKYFFAPVLLNKLKNWDTPFSQMQYHLYSGYFLEKSEKSLGEAKKAYEKALEISEQFGDFTDGYNAIAWMGLSRYYRNKGNSSLSNRYFRQARDATSYEFILEDR
jgi:Tfp pilus assembly protein PilF